MTIGIGNSRDHRVNHRNEDPPLISIGLLLLALPIRVRYTRTLCMYILVKEVFGMAHEYFVYRKIVTLKELGMFNVTWIRIIWIYSDILRDQ